MSNKKTAGLPDHLAPLLEPTPSSIGKLIAAWDGLNIESQILILTKLDEMRVPEYLNEKIRMKALDGNNAYVRYLAATVLLRKLRSSSFIDSDSEKIRTVEQRIEADPAPLVRYSLFENQWLPEDPDDFLGLPQEARLALVSSVGPGHGEKIAKLISHAVDHQLKEGKVSEIELFEILSDYINKPSFKEHYDFRKISYDGYAEYRRGKDIEDLWRLVPKLPESVSSFLIENLPVRLDLTESIADDVLNRMTDRQLVTLFNRRDIQLREFRKKTFLEAGEKRDEVRYYASTYNFDLDYSEFAAILAKPERERVKIVSDLALTHDLSLCLYAAIADGLGGAEDAEVGSREWESARETCRWARRALERRLEELEGDERKKQLTELALYGLARNAMNWDRFPPAREYKSLSKLIISGDIWGTFVAFSKAYAEGSWSTQSLITKALIAEGTGGFHGSRRDYLAGIVGDHESENFEQLEKQTRKKLSPILSTLRVEAEERDTSAAKILVELISYPVFGLQKAMQGVENLKSELNKLKVAQDHQTLLLFVVIALLVWLAIRFR